MTVTKTKSVQLWNYVPIFESAQGAYDPSGSAEPSNLPIMNYDGTVAAVGEVFKKAIANLLDDAKLTRKAKLRKFEGLLDQWEGVRKALVDGREVMLKIDDELRSEPPPDSASDSDVKASESLVDDAMFLQSRIPLRTPGRWAASMFLGIFCAPLCRVDKLRLLETALLSRDRIDDSEPVHIRPCKFDPYATPAACAAALLESSNLQPR